MMDAKQAIASPQKEAIAKLAKIMPVFVKLISQLAKLKVKFDELGKYEETMMSAHETKSPSEVPVKELVGFLKFMTDASAEMQKIEIAEQFSIAKLPTDLHLTYTALRDIILTAVKTETDGINRTPYGTKVQAKYVFLGSNVRPWIKSVDYVLDKWTVTPRKFQIGYSVQAYRLIKPAFEAINLIKTLQKMAE